MPDTLNALAMMIATLIWGIAYYGASLASDGREEEGQPRLDSYLSERTSRFTRSFLAALTSWLVFYALRIWDSCLALHGSRGLVFGQDVATAIGSMALIWCYWLLGSTSARRGNSGWPGFLVACCAGIVGLLLYECLWMRAWEWGLPFDHNSYGKQVVRMLHGIIQGISIFLLVGRLESAFVLDHLRRSSPSRAGTRLSLTYGAWVGLGYLYGAIQPLYGFIDQSGELLIWIALVLKACFVIGLTALFWPHRGSRSS